MFLSKLKNSHLGPYLAWLGPKHPAPSTDGTRIEELQIVLADTKARLSKATEEAETLRQALAAANVEKMYWMSKAEALSVAK